MVGWINSRPLEGIDFLRELLGGRRLRFTDDQDAVIAPRPFESLSLRTTRTPRPGAWLV